MIALVFIVACGVAMFAILAAAALLGGREYDQGFDAEVREFPTEYRTTHGRTLTVFDGEAS